MYNKRIQPNLPTQQQGIALIVVVMILILISILGATSVGLSIMNQRISQNAQGSKLLTQAAGVPSAIMMQPELDNTKMLEYLDEGAGPLGWLEVKGQETDEFVSCYRPQEKVGVYEKDNYRVIKDTVNASASAGYESKNKGYCDLSSDKSFTSQRALVATQVNFTRPNLEPKTASSIDGVDDVPVKALSLNPTGVDSAGMAQNIHYRVYTTAVLPTMVTQGVQDTDISTCLSTKSTRSKTSSLQQCLTTLNVPMNIQVQDMVKEVEFTK